MFAIFIRKDGWTKQKFIHHEQPIMRFEDRIYKRFVIHTGSTYYPGPDRIEYREIGDGHE